MTSTNWSQLAVVGIASMVTGFCLNQILSSATASPENSSSNKSKKLKNLNEKTPNEELEEDSDSSEDEGIDINSTSLNEIPGEVRMTLVVRQDLKMGKGKAAAQCLHAALALYKKITNPESEAYNPEMVNRWEYANGQAKITLQVPNQEEMDTLFAQAMSLGVNCYIVHDAGRTQIAAGSATVLGLGPAPKLVLDEITLELKLY
ncbi:peptidyl-tRNA hydrolase [Hyphopichia burtonii NRRL Y-1933]|uniref:peptidyl-tRNA hydrolase n=1 Tax=Hyphopichia burtonii NRRL Y-1933 TaxID=984485 RepID=A0A1E4RL60_9ASCO|nr:peptidyl-tRNA hydrolase [Hyphopichia burtonii NRRL Y-1933]ODV67835.1 peptidyl-tRNA hydrolase [Hyphopichia burtonii NRRL Y-1933]